MYQLLILFLLVFIQNGYTQLPQFPWIKDGQLGYLQPDRTFTPAAADTVFYPKVEPPRADLESFQQNLLYGFKDTTGKVVIPAGYEAVGEFRASFAWVKLDYKRYYYIDQNEQPLLNYTFDRAYNFSSGRARVFDRHSTKNYAGYGFIDTTGVVVIPLKYKYAADFIDDYVLVQTKEELWQLLDRTGNEVARCVGLKHNGDVFTQVR